MEKEGELERHQVPVAQLWAKNPSCGPLTHLLLLQEGLTLLRAVGELRALTGKGNRSIHTRMSVNMIAYWVG